MRRSGAPTVRTGRRTYSTASSLALLLDTSARRVRPGAAEDEFDKLCFEYGIELDDVVRPVDLD